MTIILVKFLLLFYCYYYFCVQLHFVAETLSIWFFVKMKFFCQICCQMNCFLFQHGFQWLFLNAVSIFLQNVSLPSFFILFLFGGKDDKVSPISIPSFDDNSFPYKAFVVWVSSFISFHFKIKVFKSALPFSLFQNFPPSV